MPFSTVVIAARTAEARRKVKESMLCLDSGINALFGQWHIAREAAFPLCRQHWN
jgi:hypothetical protein